MGKVKIEDESGDRKYFTIIPNYVLNHSTIWDREVYVQMKRIAGENGTCWASRKTLATQCGMSERRLDKSIKYLIDHKWIKKAGGKMVQTKGGAQEVSVYKIIDLWDKNIKFYQDKGVAPNATPSNQRGSTDEAKGVAPGAYKEEPLLKKNHISKAIALQTQEVIETFKEVNPSYKRLFANKTQRAAVDRLISEHGYDRVMATVSFLPKSNASKYAPTITTPLQLEDKLGQLIAWSQKLKGDKLIV